MGDPANTVPDNLVDAIPADKRTARAMVYLLEATRRARQDVAQRVAEYKAETNESLKIKKELYKELRRMKDRLEVYAAALADAPPDGPIPDAVKPLFYKFPKPPVAIDGNTGAEYWVPTPDAYTPRMIASMLGALAEHDESMKGIFWVYLWEEVKKLPSTAAEAIRDVASDVASGLFPNWKPVVIVGGIAVAAIGGTALVVRARGKR